MENTFGGLVRPVESGPVANGFKVKDHQVGPKPLSDESAILKP